MGKLTKKAVERASGPDVRTPADQKRWIWLGDDGVAGFGVRVYGSGLKVFALRYRASGGRHRLLKLGKFGDLTVEQARDLAREEKVRVLRGEDPQREREVAREAAGLATVGKLMERWLNDYAKAHRRRWKEDEYRIERRIGPDLGLSRLEDLTPARLSRWHQLIGAESPVEANRCLETLRAAWRWAEGQESLPKGAPTSNLFKGGRDAKVKRFREKSRDRWLRPEEVERLTAAVAKEADAYVRAAVPLFLLTGLRKRELLDAPWRCVDLERGEITLEETKTGEVQVRLLPPAAVAILRDLPLMKISDEEGMSPWVFPSPADPKKPRGDLKKPWDAIRKQAKLEDVTLHDLRRTSGSYMAQKGVPLEVIQKVLGHSHPAVTKLYARLASENERSALDTLSEALSGPLGFAPARKEPEALPERLRALLEAAGNDPDALVAGLRGLADWDNAVKA